MAKAHQPKAQAPKTHHQTAPGNPPLGTGATARAGRRGAPSSAGHSRDAPVQKLVDLQLLLGNASDAKSDVNDPENYLIDRLQYALSYNRTQGKPNWVSWHLNASSLGHVRRSGKFLVDTSLPTGWPEITPGEYARTGYNRGHMCPSEHRTRTLPDNLAVFLMTNMIPQAPGNDEGPWALFEVYTKDLALQGLDLFLMAGGYGSLGTLNGAGRVTIPKTTWYLAVVSKTPVTSPDQIDENVRVIALVMPNDNTIAATRWQDYRVSVAEIESQTGLRFFSNLDPAVAKALKQRVDDQ
jgi:endonuclease G, mitochondrial